jgi:hypothetical protein
MVYEIISDYKNAMAARDSANGPNATNKSFTDKSDAHNPDSADTSSADNTTNGKCLS